jgi:hypothetical protein
MIIVWLLLLLDLRNVIFDRVEISNIYTKVFRVKWLNNRMQSVRLILAFNSENRGINDLLHEAMQYHI